MTAMHATTIKWSLTTAAFFAALTAGGCGMFRGAPASAPSDNGAFATPPAPNQPDAPRDPQPVRASEIGYMPEPYHATPAPSVNVFGELDGVQRPAGAPGGDGNFQQHTFNAEGYDSAVNLDPTGKWMVFTSTRHYLHPKIYLQRVDGSAVVELTNDACDDAFPTFSPDGRRIAFCSTRSGNWDIYVMDLDGRNVVQVTNAPMQELHPTFSPDGTRLAFSAIGGRGDQWELWTANLTTGEKRQVGYGLFPKWSPDKSLDRIAFQRARQRGSRWFSLWTLDLVDGEARRQTEIAASTNAAVITPAWSPDGAHLTFATVVDPSNAAADHSNGQQDIWIVNADGTGRRRLTEGAGSNLMPCWSVDDRVYFVSDRGGAERIWSARTDVATNTATASASKHDAPAEVGAADTREIGH